MKTVKEVFGKTDTTKLMHSYMDACSNKDFQAYCDSLNIEEEILIKYTSSLEDSFTEIKNCSTCTNLNNCKNKIKGYVLTPNKDQNSIVFSYDACKKQQEMNKAKEYEKYVDMYQMPKNIKDASFKNIYKDDKARIPIIKFFKEFMDHYKDEVKPVGLYLNGSFGSGKTYLIAALFNEMAKKGVRSALVYYPEFLRSLKASFQTDYADKYDYIKKVDLLLFDDIGAENTSSWSRDEILGPIIQYRMEEHLPTFFTSNLTMEELESSLAVTSSGADKVKARRIIERIKQLSKQIELISKNRRE